MKTVSIIESDAEKKRSPKQYDGWGMDVEGLLCVDGVPLDTNSFRDIACEFYDLTALIGALDALHDAGVLVHEVTPFEKAFVAS